MSVRFFSLLCINFLSILSFVHSQPFIRPDSTRIEVQKRANLYVDPNGKIKDFYSFDHDGISIFSSPENKLKNKVECKIYWEEVIVFQQLAKRLSGNALVKTYLAKGIQKFPDSLYPLPFLTLNNKSLLPTPFKPLHGLKIAIDPGHVAGNMQIAAFELKYLKLEHNHLAGILSPIELIEGNLTLATAFFLKHQLEEAGAEVMLTRDKPNHSSFGITYLEWLKKANKQTFETAYRKGEISLAEKNRFIKKADPKDIFQNYFRFADLYERARLINAYKPDFTVVIHYNVDERNHPWTTPTSKNFNMVFVPGDLKPVFLNNVEKRVELLRLLTSKDLVHSISLGTHLVESFESVLQVPTALPRHAVYLQNDCIPTAHTGVYVRNLALTRLVHGPIAYGETLYQDNINECHLLGNYTTEIHGVKTSERVRQVAQAYYEGILKYTLNRKE